MMHEQGTAATGRKIRHRIGPALRDLRRRRGWSLRELAERANVSQSHLSRLERGASVPSITILYRLATVLEIDIAYFTTFEQTCQEMEAELAGYLQELAIPRDNWDEFTGLSVEAQGALIDAARRLLSPKVAVSSRERALEGLLLAGGAHAAVAHLPAAIAEFGMPPEDFIRATIQVEELAGDRMVVADRLSVMDVGAHPAFDQLHVYRAMFEIDPPDPLLLKWWTKARRSALMETLQDYPSRTIYPLESVDVYLRTGRWGQNATYPPVAVQEHISATIDLIRSNQNYQVGLMDAVPPFTFLVKGTASVLVGTYSSPDLESSGSRRVGLRFSRPDLAALFREYFEELWQSIPEERKDPEAVVAWLEAGLAAIRRAR